MPGLRLVWIPALAAAIWLVAGHLGFAVLDEGMIASYSRRILHGQVPHLDIVSVRPLGSAVLHIVDLAIPLPLFTTIRLMGLVEIVAYSVLFGAFLFRRGPRRWTVVESLAVAAAVLVNIHTFPLMTWQTVDGLLFTALGLVLIDGRDGAIQPRRAAAGMFCLGLAVTMKQGFFAAPLAGLWILWRRERAGSRRWITWIAAAALPGLIYLGTLTAFGALPDTLSELTAHRGVWGRPLLEVIGVITTPANHRPPFTGRFPFEVLATAVLLLAARRWSHGKLRGPLTALLSLALVAAVVHVALAGRLTYAGSWSLELMWSLVAVGALAGISAKRWPRTALVVLLVGWMTMLSFGDEIPALVGGTVALCAVAVALGDARALPSGPLSLVAAIAVFATVAAVFVHARREYPYYDRPAAQLTYDLGRVDPDLRGIRTNPVTGAYLSDLVSCTKRYPAPEVAVLPDNPGIYAALGLDNPLPLDWLVRGDYAGQTRKIIRAAQRLDRQGGYLVLFQIVSGFELSSLRSLPHATRRDVPVMIASPVYDQALGRRLVALLHGRHIVCGPFLGVYVPTGGSSRTGEPPRRSDSVAASSTPTT